MKKALTGEGQDLMKVSGNGEVFLADTAQHVHLIMLEGEQITVNGRNLLAIDADIDWDIKKVQGGSGMMAGGLFNTVLRGSGWVAILSDGNPVLLDVASAPTFADAQAAITWSEGVTTSIKTDFKLSKTLTGRSSGESSRWPSAGRAGCSCSRRRGASARSRPAEAAGWGTCSAARPRRQLAGHVDRTSGPRAGSRPRAGGRRPPGPRRRRPPAKTRWRPPG